MHDTIMILAVIGAICSDGLYAWKKNNKTEQTLRAVRYLLRSCLKVIAVWVTIHVLIVLALARGISSGGGIFAEELDKWQLFFLKKVPSRVLTRAWGRITRYPLSPWLRPFVLGAYRAMFRIDMTETELPKLRDFESLHAFFTRTLRKETRPICSDHCLVSPVDGTVLHVGRVEGGLVQQVKGVNYTLTEFLGLRSKGVLVSQESTLGLPQNDSMVDFLQNFPDLTPAKGNALFHAVIYLGLPDYHHFHAPANWNVQFRRHIFGELLSVAPWVVRQIPNLFCLNERALLAGYWDHGFFSLTAVGAYNVGSIEVDIDEELKTNLPEHEDKEGDVQMGEFNDKFFSIDGIPVSRGDHMGLFHMGSTIVLVFEGPTSFEFVHRAGDRVKFGQPLGRVLPGAHLEFGDE